MPTMRSHAPLWIAIVALALPLVAQAKFKDAGDGNIKFWARGPAGMKINGFAEDFKAEENNGKLASDRQGGRNGDVTRFSRHLARNSVVRWQCSRLADRRRPHEPLRCLQSNRAESVARADVPRWQARLAT